MTVAQLAAGNFHSLLPDVPEPAPDDFDGDGDVDGDDFLLWQTGFPKPSGATIIDGDADKDGDVDGDHSLTWKSQFGSASDATGDLPSRSTVPEPAAFIMTVVALLTAGMVVWRRAASRLLVHFFLENCLREVYSRFVRPAARRPAPEALLTVRSCD